jgi:predicted nucleotidyltransferase
VTDFEGLLRQLRSEDVRFILVGGFAATVLGSPRITVDLDIVYARDRENLLRLSMALAPLTPYLRGAPPGLPFRLDVPTLERGLNFTLTTTLGDLDLLGEITGGGTYEHLIARSRTVRVFGLEVQVVTLRQLIRLKRAAGRAKDLEALAELESLLEEGHADENT